MENTVHVYLYEAIRRKKENPDIPQLCFRQVIKDSKTDLEILKARINSYPGVWRIYRSVNARNAARAYRMLIHKMIDSTEHYTKVDTLWKTCLMQPINKAERKFLIDVDSPNEADYIAVKNELLLITEILEESKTPNGWHIVTTLFHTESILDKFTYISIKRDALFFIELVTVPSK